MSSPPTTPTPEQLIEQLQQLIALLEQTPAARLRLSDPIPSVGYVFTVFAGLPTYAVFSSSHQNLKHEAFFSDPRTIPATELAPRSPVSFPFITQLNTSGLVGTGLTTATLNIVARVLDSMGTEVDGPNVGMRSVSVIGA